MVKIEFLDEDLQNAIKETLKEVDDLTIPYKLMVDSWYKSNRSIFSLKSPGKYPDLSPRYKRYKKKEFGFIYPILKASGRLEDSMINPGGESISYVFNKRTLVLGTKVPYGKYHQLGKGVPLRPFVLLGAEQVSPPEINRRRDNWIKLLNDYVLQASKQIGKVK